MGEVDVASFNKMISKIINGMDRTLHETDGVGLQFMLDQVELIPGLGEDLINLPPRTPRKASEGGSTNE